MTTAMTTNMIQALTEMITGMTTRAMLAREWDRRTLNALESRGYITIRDYDGEIRVTTSGEQAARDNQ